MQNLLLSFTVPADKSDISTEHHLNTSITGTIISNTEVHYCCKTLVISFNLEYLQLGAIIFLSLKKWEMCILMPFKII